MSEEKLYAVKNDEDEWVDAGYTFGSGAWRHQTNPSLTEHLSRKKR
jgi:hypothetical protein